MAVEPASSGATANGRTVEHRLALTLEAVGRGSTQSTP
jgi:hypothetical protein